MIILILLCSNLSFMAGKNQVLEIISDFETVKNVMWMITLDTLLPVTDKMSFFLKILGFDFILLNGGQNTLQVSAGSSLIALDATSERLSSCSPPGDMIDARWAHMLGLSDGNLVVCGGSGYTGAIKHCEQYDQGQDNWTRAPETLEESKYFYRSVQLDNTRIWMGRKFGRCASLIKCFVYIIWDYSHR